MSRWESLRPPSTSAADASFRASGGPRTRPSRRHRPLGDRSAEDSRRCEGSTSSSSSLAYEGPRFARGAGTKFSGRGSGERGKGCFDLPERGLDRQGGVSPKGSSIRSMVRRRSKSAEEIRLLEAVRSLRRDVDSSSRLVARRAREPWGGASRLDREAGAVDVGDGVERYKNGEGLALDSENDASLSEALERAVRLCSGVLFPTNPGRSTGDSDNSSLSQQCRGARIENSDPSSSVGPKAKREILVTLFQCGKHVVENMRRGGEGCANPVVLLCEFAVKIFDSQEGELNEIHMTTCQVHICANVIGDLLRGMLLHLEEVENESLESDNLAKKKGGIYVEMAPALSCLACVFVSFGEQMKAEETADQIVRSALLPLLESAGDDDEKIGPEAAKCCETTIECISALVQYKQHASALLAPLVFDVTTVGDEYRRPNPLRTRVLRNLQRFFVNTWHANSLSEGACRCLSVVLNAIHAVERSGKGSKPISDCRCESDIDTILLAKRINAVIEGRSSDATCFVTDRDSTKTFMWHSLNLLASLAQTYPRLIAPQWHIFLEESSGVQLDRKGDRPSEPGSTPLLSMILQKDVSPDERAAGVVAAKELVMALPLHLWIRPTNHHNYGAKANRRNLPRSGHLTSRISNSCVHLLKVVCHLMNGHRAENDEVIVSLTVLARALLSQIPFDADDSFIEPALSLQTSIGKLFVDAAKEIHIHPCTVAAAAGETLVESLGGALTPQGIVTPLPLPTRRWLASTASCDSIGIIFSVASLDTKQNQNLGRFPSRLDALNMISRVVRTAPWVLVKEPYSMATFQDIFCRSCKESSASIRLAGVKMVEQFLFGRRDFSTDDMMADFSFVTSSLCPKLFLCLKDRNALVRSCAVSAYGALLGADWALLLGECNKNEHEQCHFHAILGMCVSPSRTTGEEAGSVRSAACKAVGNVCTTCVTCGENNRLDDRSRFAIRSAAQATELCHAVSYTMLNSLEDMDSSVRSMSLFAIGNLALAVKDRGGEEQTLPSDNIEALTLAVHRCFSDRNEKVVGNAIRTIGHLCYLLFHQCKNFQDGPETKDDDSKLFRSVTSSLTSILKLALDDAAGLSKKMSWRQRSNAKKHAWGACHSFEYLLNCQEARCNTTHVETEEALRQLFRCVEMSDALNEKVTLAAIKTLKRTPAETWRHFSGQYGGLSYGLAACLHAVFIDAKQDRQDLRNESGALLKDIASLASPPDFLESFAREDVSPWVVKQLYEWMVDTESESNVFQTISVALSMPDLCDKFDVSVCQLFSSRALHEHKKECSPDKQGGRSQYIDNDLDEL